MRRLALVLAAAVASVAAGCGGTGPAGGEPPEATSQPGWSVVQLGAAPVDSRVVWLSGEGVDIVLTTLAGRGLAGWAAAAGGEFVPVAAESPPAEFLTLNDAVAGPSRFLAVGTDYGTLLPVVWTSDEGRSWLPLEAEGLDRPGDLSRLVAAGSGFVAVGALRVGEDPSAGPFAPAAWRTGEGSSWELIELAAEREGHAAGVAAVGERLIAVGRDGRTAAVWRSDDGGASWSRVEVAAVDGAEWSSLDGIATDGDLVLAVGQAAGAEGAEAPLVLVSSDAGDAWRRVELPAAVARDFGPGMSLSATAAGFWLLASRFVDVFRNPARCYDEPDACAGSAPVVLHSRDGSGWAELDLAQMGGSEYPQVLGVAEDALGRPLLVTADEGELRLEIWSEPAALPRMLAQEPEPPPGTSVPLARSGDSLEPGVVYHYPLYIHCGLGYLGQLNGEHWYLVSAADAPETGAGDFPPASWPVVQQTILGFVRLVDETTIEYSLPSGEVIAVYRPSGGEPPACA